MRPFVRSAKVSSLGCSRPLQRVIVDFAADQPFAQARAKLREHYGFEIGESTIQRVTFGHAEAMFEAGDAGLDFPKEPGDRKPIIVETDGGMVPIVEPSCDEKDKRKGKKLLWREAKLTLAHAQGSRDADLRRRDRGRRRSGRAAIAELRGARRFSGQLAGSRGRRRRAVDCWPSRAAIRRSGRLSYRFLSCLRVFERRRRGDRARRGRARGLDGGAEGGAQRGRLEATLQALAGHCEAPDVDDERAPVRRCHRYLSRRKNQLNYRQALAEGLPIGSGEIESAHRYVAQQRLKRPGAWWRVEHAEHMLALRITRINGDWHAYWATLNRTPNTAANQNRTPQSQPKAA